MHASPLQRPNLALPALFPLCVLGGYKGHINAGKLPGYEDFAAKVVRRTFFCTFPIALRGRASTMT